MSLLGKVKGMFCVTCLLLQKKNGCLMVVGKILNSVFIIMDLELLSLSVPHVPIL